MFIGLGIIGMLIFIAKIVIGIGLVYNCMRGLASREGMYDRESTQMMMLSQWLGIPLGLWLLANAFGYLNIPLLPFI